MGGHAGRDGGREGVMGTAEGGGGNSTGLLCYLYL